MAGGWGASLALVLSGTCPRRETGRFAPVSDTGRFAWPAGPLTAVGRFWPERDTGRFVEDVHLAKHVIAADVKLGDIPASLLKGFAILTQEHSDHRGNDQLTDFLVDCHRGERFLDPGLFNGGRLFLFSAFSRQSSGHVRCAQQ